MSIALWLQTIVTNTMNNENRQHYALQVTGVKLVLNTKTTEFNSITLDHQQLLEL